MRVFELDKFNKDLVDISKRIGIDRLMELLGIDENTYILLEEGRQIPSGEILERLCRIRETEKRNYFKDINEKNVMYELDENDFKKFEDMDFKKFEDMLEVIRIKEKYEKLSNIRSEIE